jgi:hypothetical protein
LQSAKVHRVQLTTRGKHISFKHGRNNNNITKLISKIYLVQYYLETFVSVLRMMSDGVAAIAYRIDSLLLIKVGLHMGGLCKHAEDLKITIG